MRSQTIGIIALRSLAGVAVAAAIVAVAAAIAGCNEKKDAPAVTPAVSVTAGSQQSPQAAPRDEANCTASGTDSCESAGSAVLATKRADAEVHASKLFERACSLKDLAGCFDLGALQETGGPDVKSLPKALTTFEQACTGGFDRACLHIAAVYIEGRGVPADQRKGISFDELACTRNSSSDACGILGWFLISGQSGVSKDAKRGLALLEQAAKIAPKNEDLLGIVLRDGMAGKKDLPRALSLFQSACDESIIDACENAARMFHRGDVGPTDVSQEASLFAKGCKLGSAADCENADVAVRVLKMKSAIDIRTIWEAYDENEVAADNAYKGKRFPAWGVIQGITKDFMGEGIVELVSPNEFAPVPVYVKSKDAASLAKLRKGEKVYVDCTCDGKTLMSPVLRDCEFIVSAV